MPDNIFKNPFKLEKLKIQVYDKRSRLGLPEDVFEVMFNPSSYSLGYENVYTKYQGINTTGRKAQYSLSKPKELSLQLVCDNTVPETHLLGMLGALDIHDQVKHFLELTCYMDGEIHEPKFLKLQWGKLVFDCRLKTANVNYTLFKRDGTPLRATLEVVFVEDLSDSKRNSLENKKSPDLTRVRMLKSSETLPLKAYEFYGDATYYVKIAKINKINNFRKLAAGTMIHYPPLERS